MLKMNCGNYIRDTAIKNLLSFHNKIADKENVKAYIILTKFILKVSHLFDDKTLYLGFEEDQSGSNQPPNESAK